MSFGLRQDTCPTVQLAHQHVWFCIMWPDRAKGLLFRSYRSVRILVESSELNVLSQSSCSVAQKELNNLLDPITTRLIITLPIPQYITAVGSYTPSSLTTEHAFRLKVCRIEPAHEVRQLSAFDFLRGQDCIKKIKFVINRRLYRRLKTTENFKPSVLKCT